MIIACHSAEDTHEEERRIEMMMMQEGGRKKRQANVIDADNTRVLRQYFTNCLRNMVSLFS